MTEQFEKIQEFDEGLNFMDLTDDEKSMILQFYKSGECQFGDVDFLKKEGFGNLIFDYIDFRYTSFNISEERDIMFFYETEQIQKQLGYFEIVYHPINMGIVFEIYLGYLFKHPTHNTWGYMYRVGNTISLYEESELIELMENHFAEEEYKQLM
jgi:hypothetical protein